MNVVGTHGSEDTRVVIADRRGFDRLALEILCQHAGHVTVAASVESVADAVLALEHEHAVVLIGRQLLRDDGPASVARLRAAGALRVILVGTGDQRRLGSEAARLHADGTLERDGDALSQGPALRGESGTVPRRDEPPPRG